MNMRLALWFAAAAAALLLAACNNNTISGPPAPGPTCKPSPGTQTALIYPAPNATAVPDAFGQVVIAASPALPSSWDVVVSTVVANTPGGTFQPAPSPLPTPNAAPPAFSSPVYQSSSFSGITFQGEVVQVFLNNTSTDCTPMGPIAQFTTQ